jgi:hypothetical protein
MVVLCHYIPVEFVIRLPLIDGGNILHSFPSSVHHSRTIAPSLLFCFVRGASETTV